ncbi:MAG: hypothetical protein K1X75_11710 [Leptospirales bacterium]|nr:hypothetical protein [Leptospirales bacterium]
MTFSATAVGADTLSAMALYTIDLQAPRKGPARSALPSMWPTAGIDIISCQRLYSDPQADYFRIEALANEDARQQIEQDIRRDLPDAIYRLRMEPEQFGSPLIEVRAARKIDFRRAFVTTGEEALQRAASSLYATEDSTKALTGRRILLCSEGGALRAPHLASLHLERDAFLLARWTDLQPAPLRIAPRNEEEFIKTCVALATNGCAIRLSCINPEYALDLAERLGEQLPIPVIHAEQSEMALALAAAMSNAARLRGRQIEGAAVAIIGLGPAGHGLKDFCLRLGAARVYGIDADSRQLTRFERGAGIASSLDHVYNAADVVVVTPDFQGRLEEERFRPEQVLLSFSSSVDPRRMSTEVHNQAWIGAQLHPVFALPGIAQGILRGRVQRFAFEHAWAIFQTLLLKDGDAGLLPAPSSELIQRQAEALASVA